jgi:hypothetical protein
MKSRILTLFIVLVFILIIGTIAFVNPKSLVERFAQLPPKEAYGLIGAKDLLVVQGNQASAEMKPMQLDCSVDGPSVDGSVDGPKSMFMFTFNKASPECCGTDNASGYSTSGGCICVTEQQKKYFGKSL